MNDFDILVSIPSGSMMSRPQHEATALIQSSGDVPKSVRDMISSLKTGVYIRGLATQFRLSPDKVSVIAFSVLRVAYGKISLAELSTTLSSELKLSSEVAEKISREIEKKLFAPISLELNRYLAQKKSGEKSVVQKKLNMQNVLDLKDQRQAPRPPRMPGS